MRGAPNPIAVVLPLSSAYNGLFVCVLQSGSVNMADRFPPKPADAESRIFLNMRTMYTHEAKAYPKQQSPTAVTRGFEDYAFPKIVSTPGFVSCCFGLGWLALALQPHVSFIRLRILLLRGRLLSEGGHGTPRHIQM